jgi:hypothetical protein
MDGLPFATGAAGYVDHGERWEPDARIFVQVELKPVGRFLAMVDTAAPWCILKPELASHVEAHLERLRPATLISRLGKTKGWLYRGDMTILADRGEPLDIDAVIFLSPDWKGENFIGYGGVLQRICFAVDPGANLFYFGDLG